MISNYVIRWKLKEFKQDEKLIRFFVFKNIANCLKHDFDQFLILDQIFFLVSNYYPNL